MLEEVPQLLLLGRERGVGGARLAQPEGVLVPPREEARHQQVERRRERARREEAARRVHRVRVVAHVRQRREPALLAVLEPQVVGGGERLAGGGQEDEELRLRRLEHGRLREAAEERVELGLARLRQPEAGLLLAVQPRRAAVVAVAEVGRRLGDEREPEPRQLDPRDRRRRRRRLGARLGARLGGGARRARALRSPRRAAPAPPRSPRSGCARPTRCGGGSPSAARRAGRRARRARGWGGRRRPRPPRRAAPAACRGAAAGGRGRAPRRRRRWRWTGRRGRRPSR